MGSSSGDTEVPPQELSASSASDVSFTYRGPGLGRLAPSLRPKGGSDDESSSEESDLRVQQASADSEEEGSESSGSEHSSGDNEAEPPARQRVPAHQAGEDSSAASSAEEASDEETPAREEATPPTAPESAPIELDLTPPDETNEGYKNSQYRFDKHLLPRLARLEGLWEQAKVAESADPTTPPKDLSVTTPVKYPSLQAYIAAHEPLLVEEAVAMVAAAWEQEKNAIQRDARKDFHTTAGSLWKFQTVKKMRCKGLWKLVLTAPPAQGDAAGLDRNTVVLVQPGGDVGMYCGVVSKLKKERGEVKAVNVRCLGYPEEVLSSSQVRLWPLSSLVTLKRAHSALRDNLHKVPEDLLSVILSPQHPQEMLLEHLSHPLVQYDSWLDGWVASGAINSSQKEAIADALEPTRRLTLIQGPPGTGKTSTIVALVTAFLERRPRWRILLCGPSNAAVDEVARRLHSKGLLGHGVQGNRPLLRGELVRLGPPGSIHEDCMPLRPEDIVMQRMGPESMSNGQRRGEEIRVLEGARLLCTTLSGSAMPRLDAVGFDVIIVDEAGQATEVETLIPLSRLKDTKDSHFILVGDPQQLPATVLQHPSVAYERSLFERAALGGCKVAMLQQQYRMHADISAFPAVHFYGGRVKNAPSVARRPSLWPTKQPPFPVTSDGVTFHLAPFKFLNVAWSQDKEGASGSRSNQEEARVVAAVVGGLLQCSPRGCSLGVLTPYALQCREIKDQLKKAGVDTADCEVNTVDGFQGRELDIIVLSCVRADEQAGIGFVSNSRRMNVALTRARHCCIVVGDAATLEKHNSHWKALVRHAKKVGAFEELQYTARPVQNRKRTAEERGVVIWHERRRRENGEWATRSWRAGGLSEQEQIALREGIGRRALEEGRVMLGRGGKPKRRRRWQNGGGQRHIGRGAKR